MIFPRMDSAGKELEFSRTSPLRESPPPCASDVGHQAQRRPAAQFSDDRDAHLTANFRSGPLHATYLSTSLLI